MKRKPNRLQAGIHMTFCLRVALALTTLTGVASAGVITIGGTILQSTSDGTGPAVNNPAFNSIQDSDSYTITLDLTGSAFSTITGPGFYDLAGGSLVLSDPSAPASETSFDAISLNVTANGTFDDLSLLGCLLTGSGCFVGNQLSANFEILATMLNSSNVTTTGLDQPHPLDLLEDDGITDIHGSITSFSGTPGSTSAVPEPATAMLSCICLAALLVEAPRLPQSRAARRWRMGDSLTFEKENIP